MTRARGAAWKSLALALCVLSAACGTAGSHASPQPTLRGVAVQAFTCPSKRASNTDRSQPIHDPRELLLCPWAARGRGAPTVRLTATAPQFNVMVAALSAPDVTASTGVCPALGEVPVFLLARTNAGAYQVSIPVDQCNLYQHNAAELIFGAYDSDPRPNTTTTDRRIEGLKQPASRTVAVELAPFQGNDVRVVCDKLDVPIARMVVNPEPGGARFEAERIDVVWKV